MMKTANNEVVVFMEIAEIALWIFNICDRVAPQYEATMSPGLIELFRNEANVVVRTAAVLLYEGNTEGLAQLLSHIDEIHSEATNRVEPFIIEDRVTSVFHSKHIVTQRREFGFYKNREFTLV